jgi:hypothetical protein
MVLQGFTYKPPRPPSARALKAHPDTAPWTPGTATWSHGTPARLLLDVLSVGATWEDAARYAQVADRTARAWNTAGATYLGDHDGLDSLHLTTPPLEHLALAAFHVLAAHARITPVRDALHQISTAGGQDWRAAAHLLKVLPTATEYRERTRHEVTGEDGGPIDIVAGATETMLDLVRQFAEDPPDPEGTPDA